MKANTSLAIILATITSVMQQWLERDRWNALYSPSDGYLRIRHRSQAKQRKLNRIRRSN
jgi:hypothetical protein